MRIETERKFLVKDQSFKENVLAVHHIKQGYIAHDGGNTVRVRILDERGVLTIKGPFLGQIGRPEWEKIISPGEAKDLFGLCRGGVIEKNRYVVEAGGSAFEVDEFLGANEGLVMAEIELDSPEQDFFRPSWLGEEVTSDKRYYNSWLTRHPFTTW